MRSRRSLPNFAKAKADLSNGEAAVVERCVRVCYERRAGEDGRIRCTYITGEIDWSCQTGDREAQCWQLCEGQRRLGLCDKTATVHYHACLMSALT